MNRFQETLVQSDELFKQDNANLDFISSMCSVQISCSKTTMHLLKNKTIMQIRDFNYSVWFQSE